MLSIGDWIDKLVIENIKIFNTREKLLTQKQSSREYSENYSLMMTMVDNRAKIMNALDEKIDAVLTGKEKNEFIKRIRTYENKSRNK